MPKLTLTFDTYDERQEMLDAIHGTGYGMAIVAMDHWLRNLAKYEDKTLIAIDDVRARLRQETLGLPLEW